MKINEFKNRLKSKNTIILDGAIGTEILRKGYPTTLPLWSAEILITNPEVIKQLHKEYIQAGAEIIITNTFRTTKRALAKKNIHGTKAQELTKLACSMAKEAVNDLKKEGEVLIAGSVAPLEDCYSPEITPSDKELEKEHFEYIRDLKEGGVDFIFLETMITLKETKYAIMAAEKLNMPVAVSLCANDDLKLLGGETLTGVIPEIEKHNPLFIGINCVSVKTAGLLLKHLKTLTKLPICIYAQGDGAPCNNQGWKFKGNEKENIYIKSALSWAKNGAKIIGGCCGTTPSLIYKLSQIFKKSPDASLEDLCKFI